MKHISEGTVSYLVGCHQFFLHPLFVFIAWVREYRQFPAFWELCCIFLHDIGHIGKEYLTDLKEKAKHWYWGAAMAQRLFGIKGFLMVAGHDGSSGFPRSKLFIPDKRSWLEAPNWFLWNNRIWENFGTEASKPDNWKRIVRENARNGYPKDSHELYLENREGK